MKRKLKISFVQRNLFINSGCQKRRIINLPIGKPREYLINQLVIDVRYVAVMSETLLHLFLRDDARVTGVNGSEGFSHGLEIDVHITRNVVHDKLKGF